MSWHLFAHTLTPTLSRKRERERLSMPNATRYSPSRMREDGFHALSLEPGGEGGGEGRAADQGPFPTERVGVRIQDQQFPNL